MLVERGFEVVERADEADLTARYFASRDIDFAPGFPLRIVVAALGGA